MAKAKIKARIRKQQGNRCALSGVALGEEQSLMDTDRVLPKALGGTYVDENTRIVDPRAHMVRHDTLRERSAWLEELKATFDDRVQMMRLLLKINNQLLAHRRRTDSLGSSTESFLQEQMKPINKRIVEIDKKLLTQMVTSEDRLVKAALSVPGLGPVTVAALTTYVDISKASSASALWKYVGLHQASHERYVKGEASGGNKILRTVLWNSANVLMKLRTSPYRTVYDSVKRRLEQSEKVTKSRNTQGHLVEVAWKDTKPSHRHGAALRAVMKHLLADYWFVGREIAGLDARPLYVEAVLGHEHIVRPRERGWSW